MILLVVACDIDNDIDMMEAITVWWWWWWYVCVAINDTLTKFPHWYYYRRVLMMTIQKNSIVTMTMKPETVLLCIINLYFIIDDIPQSDWRYCRN